MEPWGAMLGLGHGSLRCRVGALEQRTGCFLLKNKMLQVCNAVNPHREAPKFKLKISVPTVNSVAKTVAQRPEKSLCLCSARPELFLWLFVFGIAVNRAAHRPN